ncbi:MAG: argininosuccinate lyase [Deltaproteobacteria bacterium]|nr:argininosuccinate lyase [Deltaproteobacteria bacterium]
MTNKLWAGRFSERTDKLVEEFTASIGFDARLLEYDIAGSIAHVRMLAKQGIISGDDGVTIMGALGVIRRKIERGGIELGVEYEDIHMLIEKMLVEEVGELGEKMHTARSRNDQIALDIRLFLRDKTKEIIRLLFELSRAMVLQAHKNIDVIMPGYTHLQRAQPVLFAHHLLAYYEMYKRDRERLEDCQKRINVMPLGSAALAGTSFPIDMEYVAELLEFPKIVANSMDGVSDRDFVIEFLSAAALIMMHLSRLAEEMILWSTYEFGFIELSDAYTTGSSIMPQKKNSDVAELTRGKCGRVYGSLIALLTTMKGLPLTYNRDLQEDKEPLFDAVDTLTATIKVNCGLMANIKVNAQRMRETAQIGHLTATDMADYLVRKGMTFRRAHSVTGSAVKYAIQQGKEIAELTLEEMKKFSEMIEEDVFNYISLERSVTIRTSPGGTAPIRVKEALAKAAAELNLDLSRPADCSQPTGEQSV